MLGPIGSILHWRWAASGKHPVASDFFRMGEEFSLGKGFSDWVGNGYRALTSGGNAGQRLYSWRFWAKGTQKGTLACGVLRDSSDRVGRPYPLLIMGMGPLKGWEEEWDLLPLACERTWNQIEYLTAGVVSDFKKLENETGQIRSPRAEWSELRVQKGDLGKRPSGEGPGESVENLKALEKQARDLSEKGESFVPLDQRPSEDQFNRISLCHSFFKAYGGTTPNAVFMGGTTERASIAFFRRPLMPGDFVRLWTAETPG